MRWENEWLYRGLLTALARFTVTLLLMTRWLADSLQRHASCRPFYARYAATV
jgi:hypothetical protein